MTATVDVHDVLAELRVLELCTLDRHGTPDTRPMASAWLPDENQIVITTTLATPQKVDNLRRDPRVALLYSDFTGSGLTNRPAVLVRGTASVPDVAATPAELPGYWRELMRKSSSVAADAASEQARTTMDWYYLRLPILVTPRSVEEVDHLPEGGEPGAAPHGASLGEQVTDALGRYPSAVLSARDGDGAPVLARVRATAGAGGAVALDVPPGFDGRNGPASLLWHQHDGIPTSMNSLQVTGMLAGEGARRTLSPERIPGAGAWDGLDSHEAWIDAARARSQRYLERRGLEPAPIDWDELSRQAAAAQGN